MPFSGTSARRPLAAGTQTVKTAVTVDYAAAIEAVEYLNQLRREAGLHDLVMDENLVESAITRASECSIYYSHTRPSGESYLTACPSGSRYQSSFYSENILWGTAKVSPQRATQTWRDSPLHYANMMDKNHQSVGIACVYARDGKSYWGADLLFGHSRSGPQSPHRHGQPHFFRARRPGDDHPSCGDFFLHRPDACAPGCVRSQ